jgi:RES domain-containing protein
MDKLVSVKEHSDFLRLLETMKLAAARVQPWQGIIIRSAPPRWAASREMLKGIGSMNSGARFNAPGSFPAIYGSTTPVLAMIESVAYQLRAGLPASQALPRVFKAISVTVERCLDLSDAAVLTDLGVSLDQLRRETWWLARARNEESLTQAIGRAAHACGIQALLAASAHTLDHGVNVIVLPDHINLPSELKVLRYSAIK